MDKNTSEGLLRNSIIDIAKEAFRFRNVFLSILSSKVDPFEQSRYYSQFGWFFKKIEEALELANMKLVDFTGKPYDAGMPVTPLNIEDFNEDDILYIGQMVTPIIMGNREIVSMGTVLLERKGE